jgi:eukaryotic-like serine/threonine-protein kinase
MRLQTGSRLGPYEISGPIGAGGMGEVYRARDTRLGREVAVKVLPHELTRDAERLARFEREARSSSALNHRNIVTVHDFGSADGETWLVLELIRGESLRDVMSRGPLPLKKLLPIATGIAEGLAAAHGAGIVHRDLKPENVMITSDGTPKILDFGLVKQAAVHDANSPTEVQVSRAGTVLGTAGYMSPEQARGENVDHRTDHFSLGLMMYEMAAGRHPFRRGSAIQTLAAILDEEAPPLGDSCPAAFVEIVERCLAKNAEERYGSTADLAHDLRRLRDGRDRPAAPRAPQGGRWFPVLMTAAGAAAVITGAWLGWRGRNMPAASPLQAVVATPGIDEPFMDEVTLPVSLSPDGRYLAVFGTNAAGTTILSLLDLRSGTSRVLAENAFSAGWSPDSKAVAYIADGKLKAVSIGDGSPPRVVCDARPEGTPAWNGETLIFTQYSGEPGLYQVSSSGGTPRRLDSAGRRAWWPQFLPDGKRFLYLASIGAAAPGHPLRHDLMIGSLDGTVSKKISSEIDSGALFANGHLLFVRDGVLLARPFDPDGLRLFGEAKPLVDDLHYFRRTGNAAFSVSANGLLAWRAARRPVRLAWLDRAGIETGSIATVPALPDGRLSPDGIRYAVGVVDRKDGASDLWVYDLARGSSERLTFQTLDERSPVWSPDGRALYLRSDGGEGPPDIALWRPGDDPRTWVYKGRSVEEPHDVSSDGKWLLFIDFSSIGTDINVLSLNDRAPRPFVATPFDELSPRFSPDGRFVAYQSNLSGRPEVYVRPFQGSAPASVRVSSDGGTRPRWSRDGKELFFLGRQGRLMAANMGAEGLPSSPRTLFQASGLVDFDVAVDGKRFLVQLQERSDPQVSLLVNWPARLGARP